MPKAIEVAQPSNKIRKIAYNKQTSAPAASHKWIQRIAFTEVKGSNLLIPTGGAQNISQ
jgi:hypothetical protein